MAGMSIDTHGNVHRGRGAGGGRFTGHVPVAPDGQLTDDSIPDTAGTPLDAGGTLVATFPVEWVERNVLPTPRHRKPRDVTRRFDTTVTIPHVTAQDAPVGFTVDPAPMDTPDGWVRGPDNLEGTMRAYDGRLWAPLTRNRRDPDTDALVPESFPATPENLAVMLADKRGHGEDAPAMQTAWDAGTQEKAAAQARQRAGGYLAVDGVLYREAGEPVYVVETYGYKRVGVRVRHVGESIPRFNPEGNPDEHTAPETVFPADQYEQAIASAAGWSRHHDGGQSAAELREHTSRIRVSGAFTPGSTFRHAPRLDYADPYTVQYTRPQDLPAEAARFRRQLLGIPGAVIDVPDGFGGTTRRVDTTRLSPNQAADYAEYVKLTLPHGTI